MSLVIDAAVKLVSGQLGVFASQDNFWSLFDVAFGKDYNQAAALKLRSQWQSGDFSLFPKIKVVSGDVLGSAKGAYASSTNTIYLSSQFVTTASQQSLLAVILEEFGHFVDAQVNATDTPGDEGELFSILVRGVSLSAAELSRIQAGDDHGIMSLGGQLITIEKAAPTILTVTTTADQNNGVTTDGLSLREAILIANANPNTDYEIQLTGGLTYNLTANGVNEDAGKTGDLDIASRNNILYIVSIGTQKATINASNLLNSDRVFDVRTNGRLSLQNVVVTGGLASDSQDGGGIYVRETGFLDLYNTTVSNNSAGDDGGGIYNFGTTYLRNGSTISNNSTIESYGSGGGIFNNSGTLTIMDSTINNNSARSSGGGIVNNGITLLVINSTISNNTSRLEGGGIQNTVFSSVALVNTTISGNSSGDGGGINNGGGVLNLRNSTITNNTAYDYFWSFAGGGITNGSGTVNLRNTIVAGNFRTLDSEGNNLASADLKRTFNGNNNNLIGTLTGAEGTIGTGTDIVNANVQLSPLQNNGGLTLTHIPLSGSPAINAGNNNQIPVDSEDLDGDGDTTEQLPFDARNLARISDGTVDIGAVEVQSSVILPSITLTLAIASVLEDGTQNLVYTFTRTGITTNSLTVNYGITGTADATDYTGATPSTGKTITFAAGSATATLTIDPTADALVEPDETVILTLATGTDYTIGTTTAVTGTITNDDAAPVFAISSASATEGGVITFTITRTGDAQTTQSVTVATSIGVFDNVITSDFTAKTQTLSFAQGETTKTFTIQTTQDTLFEPNETFTVTLSAPTNGATISTANRSVTGTIINDDPPRTGTRNSDFNGDGKNDILVQNQGAGWAGIWTMNGSTVAGWAALPSTGGGKIVGTGDFNGDGKNDIMVQNQGAGWAGIWTMNGSTVTGWAALPSTGGGNIAGIGDFNADGKNDIVVQNQGAGWAGIWTMNGSTVTGWAALPSTGGGNIAGIGDFNADGKNDIVVQNQGAGWAGIWTMNGSTVTGWAALPATGGGNIFI